MHDLVIGRRAEVGLLILGVLYTIYLARSLLLPVLLALLIAATCSLWCLNSTVSGFPTCRVGHRRSPFCCPHWRRGPSAFSPRGQMGGGPVGVLPESRAQIKEITKLGAAKKVDQMVVNGPSPADLLISRLPKTFTSRNRGNLSILRCADDFLDPEP
jgi:hypothetical protein